MGMQSDAYVQVSKWQVSNRLVDDLPLDPTDTAHGWIGKLVKGGGREVEIAICASLTPVGQGDLDVFALVGDAGDLAAHRVVVRVHTIVTGIGIEETLGSGGNEVSIRVDNTTSTQTSVIVRSLACVRLPIAVAARGGSGSGAGRRSRRGRMLAGAGRRFRGRN